MKTTSLVAAVVFLLAMPAAAQDAATESPARDVAPRPVNPGAADAPSQLIREAGLEGADGGAPSPALQGAEAPAASQASSPEPKTGDRLLSVESEKLQVSAALAASLRASYQGASSFPFDAEGTSATVAPLITRVRVAPEVHYGGFGLLGEADTATGAITGIPPNGLVDPCAQGIVQGGWASCPRVPYPAISALELRKLFLEYRWKTGAFRVGQQTSQWGLGLLANDGAHDPEAGEFGQQHFGSITWRALLATRPMYNFGGAWRAFETAFAADLVVRDSTAEFAKGDRAWQGVLALRYVKDNDNHLGVYAVYRNQRSAILSNGGRALDAVIVDVAGKWQFFKRKNHGLTVGFEAVTIQGTTTQGRNENAALLKVRQYGAALKSQARFGNTHVMLDWGFASGDQNPADDRLENFRFDRDFKVGLVLFDQVLAYQSARAAVRASDPSLVGIAPEGADLVGTGGALTGAWYLFPRVRVAVMDWLDVYGGPLFAFTTAKLTDPFNTRINGGTSLNSLGARPGNYLGTELDVGVQLRFRPLEDLLLTGTVEGGLLLPGDALAMPGGALMGPVGFGRIRLTGSI